MGLSLLDALSPPPSTLLSQNLILTNDQRLRCSLTTSLPAGVSGKRVSIV
jgi:hypothetical protein